MTRNQDSVASSIRVIGNNLAFEGGVRIALSFTARLLLGYLAGLPLTVISVNAAIAFFATALLEIPAGLFADIRDPVTAVRLGYFCQFLCALLLVFGIAAYPDSPALMWIAICAEGALDAIGNAFISGAKESAFQRLIEVHADSIDQDRFAKIRSQYMSLADRHGRWMIIFWPGVTLALALWLHQRLHHPELVFLIIALAWLLIRHHFPRSLANKTATQTPTSQPKKFIRLALEDIRRIKAPALLYLVSLFAYLNAMSYLLISVLKLDVFHSVLYLPVLSLCGIFVLARLIQSFTLPSLAAHLCARVMYLIGGLLILGAAVGMYVFWPQGRLLSMTPFLIASLAYFVGAGYVLKTVINQIAAEASPDVRATVLSILNSVHLIFQAVYSVYLTWTGQGTPSLIALIALIGIAGLASLAKSGIKPASSA